MSEFAGDRAGERVAVVFFGVVLLLMTLMLIVLGRHAESEGLFGDDLEDERKEEARVKYQLVPGLIAYIAGGAPRAAVARSSASSSTCSSPSTWRSRSATSAAVRSAAERPLAPREGRA